MSGPAIAQLSLRASRLISEYASGAEPQPVGHAHADPRAGPQLAVVRIRRDVADETEIDERLHRTGIIGRDHVAFEAQVVAHDDISSLTAIRTSGTSAGASAGSAETRR